MAGLCPKCGSGYAQRSHRMGWMDRLAALLALYPYRCWDCDQRFYVRLGRGIAHRGGRPAPRGRPTPGPKDP